MKKKLAISLETHDRIKGYLEAFIETTVREIKNRKISDFGNSKTYLNQESRTGYLKPFHAAIIPPEILRINAFERSFSSTLGTTFEECARLIALDHHEIVERNHDLSGEVSLAGINEIDHQVASFENVNLAVGGIKPTFQQIIDAIFRSQRSDDKEIRSSRADLYIKTYQGIEYFFEMKSPKPNKGQCLEVLQRILRFHLIKQGRRPELQTYYAMSYNPYGSPKTAYRWSMAKSSLPFEEIVLIGQEFWNIIGGPTTNQELLEIYHEVGHDKSKFIIDSLAFGF